jgi:hypothetical protein
MATPRIIISSDPQALEAALAQYTNFAVVEAEYGDTEVVGSHDFITLNHHVRPERECPCLAGNSRFADIEIEAIGISHVDLDTLGGVAALVGQKPLNHDFWATAAFVDLNGPHRVKESPDYDEELHVLLASFWAFSQEHRLFPPRDGSVDDVTDKVMEMIGELRLIVRQQTPERLERGRAFLRDQDELVEASYVNETKTAEGLTVVIRKGTGFTNHLYYSKDGSPADIVIGFNEKFKSVTVSRAADSVPLQCKDFVQELWGEQAGGHPGIAGSPRGEEMRLEDAQIAFEALSLA